MRETTIAFVAQSPMPTQQQSPIPVPPSAQTGIDWTAVLVPLLPAVFTGVITGLLSPIITPYVKWYFDKEQQKSKRRTELIETWTTIINQPDFQRGVLLNHPAYGYLKPLLTDEVRRQIERPTNELIADLNSIFVDPDRKVLTDEIARIEKEWGLL